MDNNKIWLGSVSSGEGKGNSAGGSTWTTMAASGGSGFGGIVKEPQTLDWQSIQAGQTKRKRIEIEDDWEIDYEPAPTKLFAIDEEVASDVLTEDGYLKQDYTPYQVGTTSSGGSGTTQVDQEMDGVDECDGGMGGGAGVDSPFSFGCASTFSSSPLCASSSSIFHSSMRDRASRKRHNPFQGEAISSGLTNTTKHARIEENENNEGGDSGDDDDSNLPKVYLFEGLKDVISQGPSVDSMLSRIMKEELKTKSGENGTKSMALVLWKAPVLVNPLALEPQTKTKTGMLNVGNKGNGAETELFRRDGNEEDENMNGSMSNQMHFANS